MSGFGNGGRGSLIERIDGVEYVRLEVLGPGGLAIFRKWDPDKIRSNLWMCMAMYRETEIMLLMSRALDMSLGMLQTHMSQADWQRVSPAMGELERSMKSLWEAVLELARGVKDRRAADTLRYAGRKFGWRSDRPTRKLGVPTAEPAQKPPAVPEARKLVPPPAPEIKKPVPMPVAPAAPAAAEVGDNGTTAEDRDARPAAPANDVPVELEIVDETEDESAEEEIEEQETEPNLATSGTRRIVVS